MLLTTLNEGAGYLTYKSFILNALNIIQFDCEITLEAVFEPTSTKQ